MVAAGDPVGVVPVVVGELGAALAALRVMATASIPASFSAQLEAERTRIGDLMTANPVAVHADLAIDQLLELLLERGLSRVPVLDDDGRLIGMVGKTDLVLDMHVRGDTQVDQRDSGGRDRHVHEFGATVRDVMTPMAISLPASTSLRTATRLMLADNLHAVPVTSAAGQLIGILSATDVMAWVAGISLS